MKDLPQNELLSAYLDGELTAAEQADVERLLAASPAARQLLDELRSLSTAIQALPRQKLGEDLSQHVLHMAERRMLTEGTPDDSSSSSEASVPLSRSFFHRFVNRRAMIWTGLAVAIAVMIAVTERRESNSLDHRAVARATPKSRATINEPGSPPPTMQAKPAATGKMDKSELTLVADKSLGREPQSENVSAKPAVNLAKKITSNEMKLDVPSASSRNPAMAKDQKAQERFRPFAASSAPLSGKTDVSKGDLVFQKNGVANNMPAKETSRRFDKSGPEVLVVYCNISPDAAKKKSFDKLLDANGITWRRELPREDKQLTAALGNKVDRDAYGKPEWDQRTSIHTDASLKRRIAGDTAELVYVEATPAQIKAALAGLEAQPNVFLSVSLGPFRGTLSESLTYQRPSDRDGVQAEPADRNRAIDLQNQLAQTAPRSATASPVPPMAAKPADVQKSEAPTGYAASSTVTQSAPLLQKEASVPGPSDESQKADAGIATLPSQAPQSSQARDERDLKQNGQGVGESHVATMQSQSSPMQRVLFVLRIIGPTPAEVHGKAAAESTEPAPAAQSTPAPAK
jgi:hypothetical protein